MFRRGSAKVMKRHTTDESEAGLVQMESKTHIGRNSTVLEYEGYGLLQYGLYEIAQDKLITWTR